MPLEGRRMDWDELDAELRRLEAKLAGIKRDFAASFPRARPGSPVLELGGGHRLLEWGIVSSIVAALNDDAISLAELPKIFFGVRDKASGRVDRFTILARWAVHGGMAQGDL